MSTSPSVIRRFVEYYAGLDAQPPAALATRAVLADCARALVASGQWVGTTLAASAA